MRSLVSAFFFIFAFTVVSASTANASIEYPMKASVKLNTIHDGYYTEYEGTIGVMDEKYLILIACRTVESRDTVLN